MQVLRFALPVGKGVLGPLITRRKIGHSISYTGATRSSYKTPFSTLILESPARTLRASLSRAAGGLRLLPVLSPADPFSCLAWSCRRVRLLPAGPGGWSGPPRFW